jgi:hypothetical protein
MGRTVGTDTSNMIPLNVWSSLSPVSCVVCSCTTWLTCKTRMQRSVHEERVRIHVHQSQGVVESPIDACHGEVKVRAVQCARERAAWAGSRAVWASCDCNTAACTHLEPTLDTGRNLLASAAHMRARRRPPKALGCGFIASHSVVEIIFVARRPVHSCRVTREQCTKVLM